MNLGLNKKRALVLGSSQGIGLGIAKALLAEGAQVAISGRDKEGLDQLVKTLSDQYQTTVLPIAVNLHEKESENYIAEEIKKHFHGLDILINNTGGPPFLDVLSVTQSQWEEYFDLMVVRLINITTHFIPDMMKQKWGRIINVASSSVIQPIEGLVLSNALRSALTAWGKTLAKEIAPYQITVNTVLPGNIDTKRLGELNSKSANKRNITVERVIQDQISQIPMGRYGTIEEFANVVCFLASEKASYMTGGLVRVDGGLIRSI